MKKYPKYFNVYQSGIGKKEFLNHSVDNAYATNSLIMNDYYMTGKSVLSEDYDDSQVEDAKNWVDENHK